MYCRKCGSEIPDDSVFCSKCGTPTSATNEPVKKDEEPIFQDEQEQAEQKRVENKTVIQAPSRKKKGPIVLVSLLVVALIIGGLYYYIQSRDILKNKAKLEAITSSCLKIECYDITGALESTGSGFIAFRDNIIITNYHVIEDYPYSIKALTENGNKYTVDRIVVYNPDVDIAILRLQKSTGLTPLTFSSKPVEKTDKVIAIGSPLGLVNVVSDGIVSGFTQIYNLSAIQFTASISHGSSGGVLLNRTGEVVGVTFASYTEGQNLNMAIPIDYVESLYSKSSEYNSIAIQRFRQLKVYSVDSAVAYCDKLKGKTIRVQGYVSTRSPVYGDNNLIFLVEKERDVVGFDGESISQKKFNNSDAWATELKRAKAFKSITLYVPQSQNNQKLQPGELITVLGKFAIYEYDTGDPYIGMIFSDFVK